MIDWMMEQLQSSKAIKQVVYFESPTHTEKVTRQKRECIGQQVTFLVTIGKPNYAERKFIEKLKQSGEPFPVKKLQLKFYPKPR